MGLWPRFLNRELVEAVAVGAGALGVGDEHGAVDRGHVVEAGAGRGESFEDVLGVVGDLEHCGVFEQGAEGGEGGGRVELLERGRGFGGGGVEAELVGAVGAAVAEGGCSRRGRGRWRGRGRRGWRAWRGGRRGRRRGRRGRPVGARDPGGELVRGGDELVGAEGGLLGRGFELGGFGGGGWDAAFVAEADGGGAEPHGVEPGGEGLAVGVLGAEVFEREGEGDVEGEFHQAAGDAGGFGVLDQHVAALAGLHCGAAARTPSTVPSSWMSWRRSWGRCPAHRGCCRRCRP